MWELKTTGEIAKEAKTTRDQVQHICRSRGIEPDASAGGYGLYAPASVSRIVDEVVAIRSKTVATRSIAARRTTRR